MSVRIVLASLFLALPASAAGSCRADCVCVQADSAATLRTTSVDLATGARATVVAVFARDGGSEFGEALPDGGTRPLRVGDEVLVPYEQFDLPDRTSLGLWRDGRLVTRREVGADGRVACPGGKDPAFSLASDDAARAAINPQCESEVIRLGFQLKTCEGGMGSGCTSAPGGWLAAAFAAWVLRRARRPTS